jgi:D-glycero-alpha-D-manno-heptose-7-phosphate kinase
MTFPYFDKIIFNEEQTLKVVMNAFETFAIHTMGRGFAMVVDDTGKLTGIVTDGDLRRGIIKGEHKDAPISRVMNRQFICASIHDSSHQILRLFENPIKQIPILDETGVPVDLIQFSMFTAAARNSFRVIRSRAPVRISFCGGGTDMSFYFNSKVGRVLSTTINKFAYCSIRVRGDAKIRLVSRDYNIVEEVDSLSMLKYGSKLDLIKACIRLMEPDFGFDMETFSEIEPGTGLGGSSAVAVSVIGVLNHFRNETHLDYYSLADLAYQSERIELKIAGGWQDQYASMFGGMNLIEFKSNDILVIPLRIPKDVLLELRYNLLLFRFGGSRVSGDIASDQRKTYRRAVEKIQLYDVLSELTLRMQQSLLRGDTQSFGKLLHDSWEIKKQFSSKISSSQIENLYATAIEEGAIGGKVLGAGESGYLLLYCDASRQSAVIQALKEKGAMPETFDFTSEGLQVWAV